MRVFVLSDIHVDYQENRQWLAKLSSVDYLEDILVLAGDVTDEPRLLEKCFEALAAKFLKVLFVPGNHELWALRDRTVTSMEKYQQICCLAKEYGISQQPFHANSLSLVPLLGWYDFSFAPPCAKLMETWMDFRACVWPDHLQPPAVTKYFLEKNEPGLQTTNQIVISFSHFVPRIDLMPSYIPQSLHYLYPALGSVELEKQIRALKSNIHVYGHSHLNQKVVLDGITYINNAFGYPSEDRITSKDLLCIYEH